MKGLLLKDIYTLSKQLKLYVLLMLVFAVIPQAGLSSLAILYAALLPITALAYDERSKFTVLASMMPYTGRQIVLSKYVLGYGSVVIVTAFSLAAQLGLNLFRGEACTMQQIVMPLCMGCVALALLAFMFPFLFGFGVERGRLIFIVIVAGVGGFAANATQSIELPSDWGLLLVPAITVALNLLSILLTIQIYRRKQH